MRKRVLLLAALLSVVPQMTPASAQTYPNRLIKMIMPAGAGGTSDAYVRAVAKDIEGRLGQTIVVENMAGAGGVIGTRTLARSAPDGYTIGWVSNAYVSHHLTNKEPQYRWPEDFTFVHKGTSVQVGLIASSKTPFKTVAELIASAKANPGKVTASNPGLFTYSFMASKQFQQLTGTQLNDVAFKTSPDSLRAVFTGEIDITFAATGLYLPGIEAGTARLLALLNDKRQPASPDIPTLKESGVDLSMSVFQGFVFPANTPAAIADRWYDEITKANQSDAVKKMVQTQSLIVETASRADMTKSVSDDVAAFAKLMKDAKLDPQ